MRPLKDHPTLHIQRKVACMTVEFKRPSTIANVYHGILPITSRKEKSAMSLVEHASLTGLKISLIRLMRLVPTAKRNVTG